MGQGQSIAQRDYYQDTSPSALAQKLFISGPSPSVALFVLDAPWMHFKVLPVLMSNFTYPGRVSQIKVGIQDSLNESWKVFVLLSPVSPSLEKGEQIVLQCFKMKRDSGMEEFGRQLLSSDSAIIVSILLSNSFMPKFTWYYQNRIWNLSEIQAA